MSILRFFSCYPWNKVTVKTSKNVCELAVLKEKKSEFKYFLSFWPLGFKYQSPNTFGRCDNNRKQWKITSKNYLKSQNGGIFKIIMLVLFENVNISFFRKTALKPSLQGVEFYWQKAAFLMSNFCLPWHRTIWSRHKTTVNRDIYILQSKWYFRSFLLSLHFSTRVLRNTYLFFKDIC